MNARRLELAKRRGVLEAHIAAQREAMALHTQPLAAAVAVIDQGLAGVAWLKRHPLAVGGAVALLAVLKPRRAWRWTRRVIFVWRGWQKLHSSLLGGG